MTPPPPEFFGDEATVGHMVADSAQSEGVGGKRYALAMLDRATNWLGFRAGLRPSPRTRLRVSLEMLSGVAGPTPCIRIIRRSSSAT